MDSAHAGDAAQSELVTTTSKYAGESSNFVYRRTSCRLLREWPTPLNKFALWVSPCVPQRIIVTTCWVSCEAPKDILQKARERVTDKVKICCAPTTKYFLNYRDTVRACTGRGATTKTNSEGRRHPLLLL